MSALYIQFAADYTAPDGSVPIRKWSFAQFSGATRYVVATRETNAAPEMLTLLTQLRRDMDSPHTDDAVRATRMAAMDAIIARAGGK